MSYADSLLSTGERVVHRVRQHWLVLVWGARIPIASIIAALLILVLSQNLSDPAKGLLGWLAAILFIGGLAFLAWATLRYLNTEFVLTNRRVVQVEGVVNKRATDSSLEKINDAVLTQSLFGRIFGFGDLDILTAAEAGIERFRMIVNPISFKRAMLDAKHEYEVDMERSGWQPSPPIRAAAAAASAPRAPEPVPEMRAEPLASDATSEPVASAMSEPTSLPPRGNADEVTRTLANLADLRDRGAISAEDYETKKADLLSRL